MICHHNTYDCTMCSGTWYFIRTGWTGAPGMKAPGLKCINVFLIGSGVSICPKKSETVCHAFEETECITGCLSDLSQNCWFCSEWVMIIINHSLHVKLTSQKKQWISEAVCHQWERWYNDFHQSKTVLISHTEQMQPSIPVSSKLCWRNCQKKLFSSEPKRKSAFSQTTKKFFFLENFLLAQWTMII